MKIKLAYEWTAIHSTMDMVIVHGKGEHFHPVEATFAAATHGVKEEITDELSNAVGAGRLPEGVWSLEIRFSFLTISSTTLIQKA